VAWQAHRTLADSEALVGRSGGAGPGAWSFSHRQGFAFRVRQAEAVGGIGGCGGGRSGGEGSDVEGSGSEGAPDTLLRTAGVSGTDDAAGDGLGGVPDRVGRAARQGAHSVERDDGSGPGWAEPGVVGIKVIQIVPQMKILVAIEAVDGRKYAPSTNMQSLQKTRL